MDTMKKIKSKIYVIRMLFIAFLGLFTQACNKPDVQIESETGKYQRELKYASSITYVKGVCRIDTNLIFANRNKKVLVAALVAEKLIDKNTVLEIPEFIRAFFAKFSEETEFSMANPGEKYQVGWFDLGKGVPTKQLIYFGLGKSTALFSYYSGGLRRYQRLVIIQFEGDKITDFWFDNYDVDARTKDEMIEYLKSNRPKNGC